MKYCKHCGKEIEENVVICPNCGCPVKEEVSANGARTGAMSEIGKIMKICAIVAAVLSLFYAIYLGGEMTYDSDGNFNVWAFLNVLLTDLPVIAVVFGLGEVIELLQNRK